ncbi:AMP-binding protein [Desulfogranum mediterraneum]|uniref:AMP-binding protein n=1 Tax=Desulfogranum mediterraneum TaxID=160661 RepID=UPI00042031C3|nr:AMP-binding protein [Desulfogranum mediterraneum]
MLLQDHHKTAIVLPDRQLSYGQLLSRAGAFAELIPPQSRRVMIFAPNRVEWIAACYGAWSRECTVVPVDYLSTPEELLHILRDCRPELLCTSAETMATTRAALEQLDYAPLLLDLEELPPPAEAGAAVQGVDLPAPETTGLLIYTSGTTGLPKGVMLSFANILANIEAVSHGVPIYNPEERVLMLLPLHHIFPLLGTMVAPLFVGATIALCPTLQAEDIITTLQQNRVTILVGVPRLYQMISRAIMAKIRNNRVAWLLYRLAERLQHRPLSRRLFASVHRKFGGQLKYLVSGGAALDPVVGRQFTTLGFEVLEGYGMTEAAPMISFTRPGKVKIGSAGTALPGTEIEICDGEILARGRNIMQGYWNKPEETAATVRDGWLHSGDLGYLDEQGRLFITGRKKEILVLANGKNINPLLLEQQLEAGSEFILEAGVFLDQELLQAIIRPDLRLLRENNIAEIDTYFRTSILEPFNQRLPPYQRILKFSLVDGELPKTRLSKLQRFLLPELARKQQQQKKQGHPPELAEYPIIREYIESLSTQPIHPDDHLELDIGLDSLDKISLLTFIKNSFGLVIAEEELMQHQSPAGLSRFVHAQRRPGSRARARDCNWQQILQEPQELELLPTWPSTNLLKHLARALLGLTFSCRTEGREHLPSGPCILAPNHQSYLDGLFVASSFSNRFMARTYFYAKEKHLRKRWLRAFAERNNVIVMDIHSDVRASLQKSAALLARGKNIMIFPEGTRSHDGNLGAFKKTFAILSKELNIPVVPVTISGAFAALPRGSFFPRPFSRVTVHFQRPVLPGSLSYEELKDEVRSRIQACLPGEQPGQEAGVSND